MVVVAKIKARQEKQTEVEKLLEDLVSRVKTEPGTLGYTLNRHQNDPTTFLVYEKYRDAEAMMEHTATDHFKEAFDALEPLLAERPDIQTYDEIAAIGS